MTNTATTAKTCLGCSATLEASDPDICERCDEHGIGCTNCGALVQPNIYGGWFSSNGSYRSTCCYGAILHRVDV